MDLEWFLGKVLPPQNRKQSKVSLKLKRVHYLHFTPDCLFIYIPKFPQFIATSRAPWSGFQGSHQHKFIQLNHSTETRDLWKMKSRVTRNWGNIFQHHSEMHTEFHPERHVYKAGFAMQNIKVQSLDKRKASYLQTQRNKRKGNLSIKESRWITFLEHGTKLW